MGVVSAFVEPLVHVCHNAGDIFFHSTTSGDVRV